MDNQVRELTKLPNIGKNLAQKLLLVGIENAGQLKEAGAENAFIRLKTVDSSTCINTLYALEGAIQEIRWHDLEDAKKRELLEFFRMTEI